MKAKFNFRLYHFLLFWSYAPVNTSLHLFFHQNFLGGGVKRPLNNEDAEDDDNTASSGRGGYNVFKTAKEQLVNMIIFLLYCCIVSTFFSLTNFVILENLLSYMQFKQIDICWT